MANQLEKYKGATYGQAAGMGIQDVLQGLLSLAGNAMQQSPGVPGARALGALTETPSGQNPTEGIGQAMAQLGPYQKGVQSALKKAGESHAVEALQSGVSPDEIQNHSMMQPPQAPMQQPMQPTGMSMGDTPQQGGQPNVMQLLSQLLGYRAQGTETSGGQVQPGTLLGFQEPADSVLQRQQARNLAPANQVALEKQKATDVPPTQAEILNAGVTKSSNLISAMQPDMTAAKSAKSVADMIDSYSANPTAVSADLLKASVAKELGDSTSLKLFNGGSMAQKFRQMKSAWSGKGEIDPKALPQIKALLAAKAQVHNAMIGAYSAMMPQQGGKSGQLFHSPSTGKYYDAQGNVVG